MERYRSALVAIEGEFFYSTGDDSHGVVEPVSIIVAWLLLNQIVLKYSATEYTSANADILSVSASAPQLVLATW